MVFLLVLFKPAIGQNNLFDCNNSRKFADYLYNTGQFELAKHELERINFFCESDSNSQLILLKSYRKLNQFEKANQFFNTKTFPDLSNLSSEFRQEYIRLLMMQQQYAKVQEVIKSGLSIKEEKEHLLATNLLMGNWETANQLSIQFKEFQNLKINALKSIAERSVVSKRKKPWLATLMSVVIPGSGKMYCGYWGDGVMSLLFSASSGFFTYRAFNKYGNQKIYPWIAGGLAISYYTANIYGGNRAAVRYNENLNHGLIHESEQVIFSDY